MRTLPHVLRLILLVTLLLLLPAGAGQVNAAPNVTQTSPMRLINQIGGEAHALAISGGYAYLGVGPRLFILDVSSNPGHVNAVLGSTLPLPGWIESIDVSGNYAYLALWEAGLAIVDVSQPSAPHLVGQFDTEGQSYDVIVEGNDVYLSDGWWGIRKIDVSNKSMPVEVANLETNYARQLAIYGNYLYLADENALMVIDKSTLTQVATDPIKASQVVISGNFAYVAYQDSGDYSLAEFNLANPAAPQKTASSSLGGFSLSTINGIGYAIGSPDWTSSTVREISGLGTGAGLSLAGDHVYKTSCSQAVGDANNYVYVTCADLGMSILQRNPLTGALTGPTGGYYTDFPGVQAMALSGNNLYLAVRNRGLVGLDISDLGVPGYFGGYDTSGFAQDVALAGKYALVADGDKGLRSIDVSTNDFQFRDTFLPGTYVTSVAVFTPRVIGNPYRVYVGDYDGNFYVLDLSSTTGTFSNVTSVNVGGSISEIKLYFPWPFGTSYAYLAVGGKGLVIVATGSMSVVKTILGNANDVEIRVATNPSTIYAYVTNDLGLTILDVTDPVSTTQESFYALTDARAVDVLNDQIFLTAGYDVWMLNGTNLSQPEPVGFYKRANYSYDVIGVKRTGDPTVTVLTADTAYGLYVLGPAERIYLPLCVK